ncbi:MAG: response regulator FixJ [Pseudomonadales bacterium]
MSNGEPTVFIVDDDDEVRDSLEDLVDSVGLKAEIFASAQEFLAAYDPLRAGCLVLDIRMPGMSGLELQEKLGEQQAVLPIIFITGHGDVPMAVEAMRRGAVDFIQKPFRDQDLLDRINSALAQGVGRREDMEEQRAIEERINSLTRRERQVMEMVVEGKANKVIAIDLGLSQRTVEVHRANVMEKMRAKTLADLVRMVSRASS